MEGGMEGEKERITGEYLLLPNLLPKDWDNLYLLLYY